jgi:coatomer protein complex subunit epsilon
MADFSAGAIRQQAPIWRQFVQEQAVEGIQDLLSDPATANNTTLILAAASILSHEGNYADALKFTHASTNLEV